MLEIDDTKDGSKHGMTIFFILDVASDKPMIRLQIEPKTGRTHQISLQARHSGLFIIGDELYTPETFV